MRVRPSANISQAHKYSRVAFVFIALYPLYGSTNGFGGCLWQTLLNCSRNWLLILRNACDCDRFRNVMLSYALIVRHRGTIPWFGNNFLKQEMNAFLTLLSGWGLPMPPPSDQSFCWRFVVGANFCSSAVQNQPLISLGSKSGRLHPLKSQRRPEVQMYFCCRKYINIRMVKLYDLSLHREDSLTPNPLLCEHVSRIITGSSAYY